MLRTLAPPIAFAPLLALVTVACSSSNSPGPVTVSGDASVPLDGGGDASALPSSCAGSPVVWDDDGTTHCASGGEAILSSNTIRSPFDGGPELESSLEVVVLQGSSPAIFSFSVGGSGPIDGTYGCSLPAPQVELTYDAPGVFSSTMSTCSVTVAVTTSDGGGSIASGTFSATLAISDGGTKTLSNGTFELPVTAETQ